MDPGFFGTERVTDEDRAYHGSRFAEVREALFANPYQQVWGGAGEPPLPVYGVHLAGVLRGVGASEKKGSRAKGSGADLTEFVR